MGEKSEVTLLLQQMSTGKKVYDKLYPLVYEELQKLASRRMSLEASDHTYSKTELVHEAYLKMIDQSHTDFSNKSHFLALASRCMRQILIDHARKKNAEKRGGNQSDLTYIDGIYQKSKKKSKELIEIDEALDRLAKLNPRLSEVVIMRFYGEMKIREIASVLGVSESTVNRDWMKARGWLHKELKGG